MPRGVTKTIDIDRTKGIWVIKRTILEKKKKW